MGKCKQLQGWGSAGARPSPTGTLPFCAVTWLPPAHPMCVPPPSGSPPCFSPCYSCGWGLSPPWTLSSTRTGACPPRAPVSLARSTCTEVSSDCPQGGLGSDRPQRAGDGAGAPLPFILFAGLSRPLPRGSGASGKLRGALTPTHLPSVEPLQPLAAGRVLQAQISRLDAKEQATDGFRLQEGANARPRAPA